MISQLEQNQPNFETSDLTKDTDLALNLWERREALFNAEALKHELAELLDEIASSSNDWDQDRRDAALSLVQALAARPDGLPILNGEQQAEIGKSYIRVVEGLRSDADWLGAPWTAVELGKSVSTILGKEIDFVEGMRLRGQLAEAWSNYAAEISFKKAALQKPELEEKMFADSFRPQLSELQRDFLSRTNNHNQHESQRSSPPLEKPVSEIAIWYGQATRQDSSAKLAVLRTTPDYIKSLEVRGVDIATFWNFNDPNTANKSLDDVLKDPLVAESFRTKFGAKTGGDFDTLSVAEKRTLADLNLDIVREVYASLFNRRTSFDEVSKRITGQIDQAEGLDNPRAKLRPILKWVRQIAPDFQSYNPAEIKAFLEEHQAELRTFHENKFNPIDLALKAIETALPPQSGVVRFMDRDVFDLKSANLTADCTAWNLDDGFNAWTVPVWLTNPSFNFAYINHGNAMVAKFGLILAFDAEQKPQVIIDSVETNKNLQNVDEDAALGSIYAGFMELQKWADRNGFGTLKVCTFTNSRELTANLPIIRGVKDDGRRLSFDGLLATEEFMKKADIASEHLPSIYLQSSTVDDDYMEEYVHGEYVEGAETFESMAGSALEKTRTKLDESRITEEQLLNALRSGDQDEIIDGLIAALIPKFSVGFTYPLEYEELRELYFNCRKAAQDRNMPFDIVFNEAISSLLEYVRNTVPEGYGRGEQDEIDWSYLDDEGEFEHRLAVLRAEKELESLYPEDERDKAPMRSELLPRGMTVVDVSALQEYLDTQQEGIGPEYSDVLDILKKILGDDPGSPSIDIVRAARYVFGVVPQPGEVQETNGTLPDTIVPLQNNMPDYDRREMAAFRA